MKKLLSVLLCLAFVCVSFYGCSEKPQEETETNELKITYDAAYLSYDSSTVSAYENVCKAVLNREESVRINLALNEEVRRLFYTSFPLNVIVESLTENENGEGFDIKYKLSADEHKAAVDAFTAKINEISQECKATNTTVYAINAYHYVSSHAKVSDDLTISCYDTIMKGEGSSFSYAQMLTYLFLQGGIPACYVTANDAVDGGYGVVQAKLYDGWFYFDPLGEFYDNGGENIVFFGMTNKDLKKTGLKKPTYSDNKSARDASDLYFDTLRYSKSYEIAGNTLLVTTTKGDVVQIAL